MSDRAKCAGFKLRLPATSANLGPGFDAVAVALDFFLEIHAEPADEFSIVAKGRDAERCALLKDNLILETYKGLLDQYGRDVVPLVIRMANGIPLGMGFGSSAAGRLAAIALATHFGSLDWTTDRILEEAYRLEGHPDNVAACWLGGFATAMCEGKRVFAATVTPPNNWRAIVVFPSEPLPTSEARAMLPAHYSLDDVVANLQCVATLAVAFAQGRGELLRLAMNDRIHQPYRAPVCPLLPLLAPLVGKCGILGVVLSGAGPAALAVVEGDGNVARASAAIESVTRNTTPVEQMVCRFSAEGARQLFEKKRL